MSIPIFFAAAARAWRRLTFSRQIPGSVMLNAEKSDYAAQVPGGSYVDGR